MRSGEPAPPDDLVRRNAQLTAEIDELRQANEALVFAAARYLALHDLAPVPLLTVDGSGELIDVNEAAAELLGAPREQILTRNLAALLSASTRGTLPAVLAQLFADGQGSNIELTVVRGADLIELAIDGIVLPDKGPARAVLACVDVTTRKRDEAARRLRAKRAEDAQRLESLGVLAGGVAHDFNNLMTVVLAGADAIVQELGAGARHTDTLLEVREAARHAGDLAHQMLAYSGRVSVPAHPIDVVDLIQRLEPLIRASASPVRVVLDLSTESLCVSGDEPQLRQMVLNLVLNAAESMAGRPGDLTISARAKQWSAEDARSSCDPSELAPGRYVVVEVRDAGVGMAPETLARIFDPYYSTKFAGRGLGLAVVHGVVRGHGGAMNVTSVLGVGSRFTVDLPATDLRPARSEPDRAGAPGLTGTVLLVDDDPLVRRLLTRVLGHLGVVVRSAETGAEALELLRDPSERVDVVVTDLTMPGMDGVELAREIRARYAAIPIVLISGYGHLPSDITDVFAGYLGKPFDVATLRALLEPLLTPGTSR